MLLMALVVREPVPNVAVAARSQGLSWTGGLFGAVYIAISILLLPRLGPPLSLGSSLRVR